MIQTGTALFALFASSFANADLFVRHMSLMGPPGTATLLDGSFEDHSFPKVGCGSNNLDNVDFTAGMAHLEAYGNAEQMDVMTIDCPYSPPLVHGRTKLAMSSKQDGVPDGFTTKLSYPMKQGETYYVMGYISCVADFDSEIGELFLGITN